MAGGSSNAIGTGSLVLSANADKLVAGLNRAETLTRKSAEKIQKTWGADFNKALFAGFAGGAVAGKVTDLASRLVNTVFDFLRGGARMQEQTESIARSFDLVAKSMDRSIKRTDEWLDAIADPKQRLAALGKEVSIVERRLGEANDAMKYARDLLTKLRDDTSAESVSARLQGKLEESTKRAEIGLKAAEATVDKLTERFLDLSEARNRALNPANDPALVGEVNKLTESLKLQAATFGMTAGQAKLYELRLRGATAEQLREAETLTEQLDRLQGAGKGGALDRLSGAFEPNSTGAYSIVAKFQTGNMLAANETQKQTRELQRINVALNLLRTLIASRGTLDVI